MPAHHHQPPEQTIDQINGRTPETLTKGEGFVVSNRSGPIVFTLGLRVYVTSDNDLADCSSSMAWSISITSET